jgi:hypothetical protein
MNVSGTDETQFVSVIKPFQQFNYNKKGKIMRTSHAFQKSLTAQNVKLGGGGYLRYLLLP